MKYQFLEEKRCGNQKILHSINNQGSLEYPINKSAIHEQEDDSHLFCYWQLDVSAGNGIGFNVINFNSPSTCSPSDLLLFNEIPVCAQNSPFLNPFHNLNAYHSNQYYQAKSTTSVIIKPDELLNGNQIQLSVHSQPQTRVDLFLFTSSPLRTEFSLYWTELHFLPKKLSPHEPQHLARVSRECEFFCNSSRTCISRNLVCNSIPNCPLDPLSSSSLADDEVDDVCSGNTLLTLLPLYGPLVVSIVFFILIITSSAIVAFRLRRKYLKKRKEIHF